MAQPLQTTPLSSTPAAAASTDFVEKTPLERYVPPAKPSLVGFSRAQLTEALASIGVPAAQRKMRAQQIWHWLYVRGARGFDEMTSVSKEVRALLERHFTLARGRLDRSWRANPAGSLLAPTCVVLIPWLLAGAARGRPIGFRLLTRGG